MQGSRAISNLRFSIFSTKSEVREVNRPSESVVGGGTHDWEIGETKVRKTYWEYGRRI